MKLLNLVLQNIGPFSDERIVFEDDIQTAKQQVTIITGENGSGKTVIIDAIRYLMYGYNKPYEERNIVNDESNFRASLMYTTSKGVVDYIDSSKLMSNGSCFELQKMSLMDKFSDPSDENWYMFDYWTSKLSTDSFNVLNITMPNHRAILNKSLSGIHSNQDVTQLIVYFDYMRSSDDPIEAELGKTMFELTKKIFNISLNNGHFIKVQRGNLKPLVSVFGSELTLEKLSSGNLYLLQRLISLLGKAYAIYSLRKEKTEMEDITLIPGILIIDEAENHLHPKWQKTFLRDIISIFPNLQIIVTTHSPFIVSSVKDARVYVCESHKDKTRIVDASAMYSNKPIDEILSTKLFNTSAFGIEISVLLAKRKQAILEKNNVMEEDLEKQLLELNPQYFSFFRLEKLLRNGGIDEAH